ncbi:MAG: DNA helicase IV [Candidatus Poriferisodalaceae bacterium]
MTHPDLEAEQAFIDNAYLCLDQARKRAVELRGMVEVGRGGTTQARYERDVIEEKVQQRLGQLEIGAASLIFGRIDSDAEELFYIGRLAVADDKQEVVVVDWRAPVAEPFYRATGRQAMGLVRRRHFVSRGRELVDMEDEIFDLDQLDDNFQGHGALLAALEQNRDGQLRDIVATIQGEQDEIIRDELKGIVVVQGGPGTGKTVVALHRAAYLLYTFRFPLEGQGVLVIGPNRLFLRYIEQVLPSLGEAGVHLSVLADLFTDMFPNARFRLADSPASGAIKGNLKMVDLVRKAVRDRQRPLTSDFNVGFGLVRLRVSKERSAAIVKDARRRFRYHNAGRKFIEAEFFRALAESHRSNPDPDIVSYRIGSESTVKAALESMWPILTPEQLLRDLYGSKALIRSAGRRELSEDQVRALYRPRGDSQDSYVWSDSDVAVLDEAYGHLGPRPAPKKKPKDPEIRTYGHIVIDEVQDHTPMAMRMLARRSLNGSMTIVGDIAQATSPGAARSWDEVLEHLPTTRTEPRMRELTLSYRIPAPNLVLANRVLAEAAPELTPPRAVRSTGTEPQIIKVSDDRLIEEVVATIRSEAAVLDGGSVAVIVPASLIDEVDAALGASDLDYGRATTASRNITGVLHPRISLVPVQLVKGLELDGSVVVEPGKIVSEEAQGLRALYVGLTRSTKRLAIVHAAPLPEVLQRTRRTRRLV